MILLSDFPFREGEPYSLLSSAWTSSTSAENSLQSCSVSSSWCADSSSGKSCIRNSSRLSPVFFRSFRARMTADWGRFFLLNGFIALFAQLFQQRDLPGSQVVNAADHLDFT